MCGLVFLFSYTLWWKYLEPSVRTCCHQVVDLVSDLLLGHVLSLVVGGLQDDVQDTRASTTSRRRAVVTGATVQSLETQFKRRVHTAAAGL